MAERMNIRLHEMRFPDSREENNDETAILRRLLFERILRNGAGVPGRLMPSLRSSWTRQPFIPNQAGSRHDTGMLNDAHVLEGA